MIIQTEPVSNNKHRVISQCYTMDALEGWISVRAIPPRPAEKPPLGKEYSLYHNPQTDELWYELVECPPNDIERICQLEQTLADLAQLLIEKGVLT